MDLNNTDWPWQPPTEKVLKLNRIYHDSVDFFQKVLGLVKFMFFKKAINGEDLVFFVAFFENIYEFKNLDDSEILNNYFPGLRNLSSPIDLSSLCNLTGLTSPISSKNVLILIIGSSLEPKLPVLVLFLWIVSSKTQFFADIWYSIFRRLLRSAYVIFWILVDKTQMSEP